MNRRYLTVDVFTDKPFEGNPLAVMLDADGLSTRQMQKIAAEFGYAETTFVLDAISPEATARMRIFTPVKEMPFAGHPNIGTAFVLAKLVSQRLGYLPNTVVLEQPAGVISLDIWSRGDEILGAELVTPKPFNGLSIVPLPAVAKCLGLSERDVLGDNHPPQIASVGMPFLFVELASRDALRACSPNKDALQSLLPLDGASAIYAYTRDVEDSSLDCDIESRMFTVRMTEDPATGGAAAALTALLAKAQGSAELDLRIVQGTDIGRPSLLSSHAFTKPAGLFVKLGGQCVSMMEGSFFQENDSLDWQNDI